LVWRVNTRPSCSSFSRRHAILQIEMISFMRVSGSVYGTPWKPSMTCGPEAPRPSTKRPSERASRPAAVWAIQAGVRL
jgi:hypothetical protein